MSTTTSALITVSEALQALVETLQKLDGAVPVNERAEFQRGLERIRRKRAALQVWVEESRGEARPARSRRSNSDCSASAPCLRASASEMAGLAGQRPHHRATTPRNRPRKTEPPIPPDRPRPRRRWLRTPTSPSHHARFDCHASSCINRRRFRCDPAVGNRVAIAVPVREVRRG